MPSLKDKACVPTQCHAQPLNVRETNSQIRNIVNINYKLKIQNQTAITRNVKHGDTVLNIFVLLNKCESTTDFSNFYMHRHSAA
jgi:hypothetical protein